MHKKHLALVRRDTGAILNKIEYYPFVQGSQEKATEALKRYRTDWYAMRRYNDVMLDIKELVI